jgi:hypothetical protein
VTSISHPNNGWPLGNQFTCPFYRVTVVAAHPTLLLPRPDHTLVSVRRVVPSSDVTMDTWEVGVPGSSSTVTVSSSTSGASGIVASDAWLPGLCSWGESSKCQRAACQGFLAPHPSAFSDWGGR